MNLTRYIKLKKLNGELDSLDDDEKYFLSILGGDSKKIYNKFDSIENHTIYIKNNDFYLDVFSTVPFNFLISISNSCYRDFYLKFNYYRIDTNIVLIDLFKKIGITNVYIR